MGLGEAPTGSLKILLVADCSGPRHCVGRRCTQGTRLLPGMERLVVAFVSPNTTSVGTLDVLLLRVRGLAARGQCRGCRSSMCRRRWRVAPEVVFPLFLNPSTFPWLAAHWPRALAQS